MPYEPGMHTYGGRYNYLIDGYIEGGERINLVVKQARLWPGVPINSIFKPIIVFATNDRLLILSRHYLGLKNNVTIIHMNTLRTVKLQNGIILSSILFGSLGALSGTGVRSVDGLSHYGSRVLLNYINNQIKESLRPSQPQAQQGRAQKQNGKYCADCGAQRLSTYKYCPNCGTKFQQP